MRRGTAVGILVGVAVSAVVTLWRQGGVLNPARLQPDVVPLEVVEVRAAADGSGREGVLALRNLSGRAVEVWPMATLEEGAPGEAVGREVEIGAQRVEAGSSGRIVVGVPFDGGWRFVVRVAYAGETKGTHTYGPWVGHEPE